MIHHNEVRVGNLILEISCYATQENHPNFQRLNISLIESVHQYHGFDIQGSYHGLDGNKGKDFYGLPLSDEILKIAGLESDYSGFHLRNSMYISSPTKIENYYKVYVGHWDGTGQEIDEINGFTYFHELQNFWFCLCGEDFNYSQEKIEQYVLENKKLIWDHHFNKEQ